MKQDDLFLLFEKKKKRCFRHFAFFLKIEYGFISRIHFRFNLSKMLISFFLFAQAGLVFVA